MSCEPCTPPTCCESECPPMKKAKTSECCAEEKCISPCAPTTTPKCDVYPCFSMEICSLSDMESMLAQNKDAWISIEYCDESDKCCMQMMIPLENHKMINAMAPGKLACYKPISDAKTCVVCFDCTCMDAPVPIDCDCGKVIDLEGWCTCHADAKNIKIKCFVCKDCGISCSKSSTTCM